MLFRKMLRDMNTQRAQFLSVFSLIFIGLAVYAGMSAEGEGMKKSADRYYRETNLADAMIQCASVNNEDIRRISGQSGIAAVEKRMQTTAVFSENKKVSLSLHALAEGKISKLYRMSGMEYDADQEGVWLDSQFADAHHMKVGDILKITTAAGDNSLKINGLVMQPEYIYAIQSDGQILPDHKNYGYAFVSAKQYPDIADAGLSQLLIKGTVQKKMLEQYAATCLTDQQAVILMQKEFQGQQMFANEIEQQKAVQAVFPFAFLLIALLTMTTAMIRMTANQRTQIGTLKAVGMADWKIYIHYISYGALPAAAGAALGVFSGSLFLPKLMFYFQSQFYALPKWEGYVSWTVYAAGAICVLCCIIAAYLACRRELLQAAADILRPRAPKFHTARILERGSFAVRWNIRDVFRNKMRSFITVAGVAGCAMLILCALGLNSTIDGLLVWMYEDLYTYETKVMLGPNAELPEQSGEVQYIQETQVQVKANGETQAEPMTVVGDGAWIRYVDEELHRVELPEHGLALTEKTAELLEMEEGDVVRWKPNGSAQWISTKITGIIRSPLAQGMYFTEQAYEEQGCTMTPTAFLSGEKAGQMKAQSGFTVQSKEELVADMDTLLSTMNVIIGILIGAAVFLGVVVLYNLGVLSFAEKTREFATLKVLGFEDKKLKRILTAQNVWLTVAGTALGLPLGFVLLSYLLTFMGDTMDMVAVIHWYTCLSSGAAIILLSLLVSRLTGRQMHRIQLVEALKGVE